MDNYITYRELLLIAGILILLYFIIKFIRVNWLEFLDRLNYRIESYESGLFQDKQAPTEQEDDFLKVLEKLINDLRYNILVKAGKTATKAQLLEAIAEKVAYYDGLHHTAFRYALNNYIIHNTQNICGVKIEEEELEALLGRSAPAKLKPYKNHGKIIYNKQTVGYCSNSRSSGV